MAFVSVSKRTQTNGFSDCLDITTETRKAVEDSGIESGLATVFVPGSTAGVTTIEYESGAINDLVDAIERVAPQGIPYNHDRRWGDGNGFSHVRAALLGPSITVPFKNKELLLGQWQQIILIDFDNRGRNREYTINILGDS